MVTALERIESTFTEVDRLQNAASLQAVRTDFSSGLAEVSALGLRQAELERQIEINKLKEASALGRREAELERQIEINELKEVSALGRRQAELDRQIEINELKEAEDLSVQWKFLREQTSALAGEFTRFQRDTRVALAEAERAMTGVDRIRQENEELKAEIRGLRAFVYESVESRFKMAKQELEAEEKKRIQGDADVVLKVVAFEELLASRDRETRAAELEMSKVNRQVATQEFLTLKENLDQEVEARRASVDSALHQLHNLQNVVLKDHREQMIITQEKILSGQTGLMEQMRGEIQAKYDLHNGKLATLSKLVGPALEEMPLLKKRVQEFDAIITFQKREYEKVLERVLADRTMVEGQLERRMQEMMALAQREKEGVMPRMRELFDEQMTIIKSKLIATFNEQMEVARVSRQDLFQELVSQLTRETEAREAQAAWQKDQWNGHRLALDGRLEILETSLKGSEQSQRNKRYEDVKLMETMQLRIEEQLERKIRDLRLDFQTTIEQRTAQLMQNGNVEDYLEYLDGLLQNLRDAMLLKTSRFSRQRPSITSLEVKVEEARELSRGRELLALEERDRVVREEARELSRGRELLALEKDRLVREEARALSTEAELLALKEKDRLVREEARALSTETELLALREKDRLAREEARALSTERELLALGEKDRLVREEARFLCGRDILSRGLV